MTDLYYRVTETGKRLVERDAQKLNYPPPGSDSFGFWSVLYAVADAPHGIYRDHQYCGSHEHFFTYVFGSAFKTLIASNLIEVLTPAQIVIAKLQGKI